MKSLTTLWQVAAEELAAGCNVSTTRDVETARARTKNEGLSFLTITLPNFCSDLEKGLDQGFVSDDLFSGFRRVGGLPAFLQGFLRRIFDAKSGVLLISPCIESIRSVRQLLLMFKKVELPCTPGRLQKALEGYVSCETDLKTKDREWTGVDHAEFSRWSAILFGDVFDLVNREVDEFALSPKHGPGATADRKVGNQKFVQTEWPVRLESTFPYGEYVLPNWRHYDSTVKYVEPSDERPVRVKFVPKTLKTPRVIAVEPTAMQYAQQALMNALVPKLETMTPSRYFVGFTDQIPNQDMAREGSLTGDLATLDLSEASDRVLNSLVIAMLRPWPSLSEAVQASRTRTAELPDGQRIRLSKFASMGSALCFPIEAMVFTTIAFMGIDKASQGSCSPQVLIKRMKGKVRVYGDDIIVPTHTFSEVTAALEAHALKVNTSKSFSNGKFRESCGGDYYDGDWVTPIRVKHVPPVSRQNAQEMISWVAMSNSFHKSGMWKTAAYAANVVEKASGPLNCVPWNSQGIGLHSYLPSLGSKWDTDRHLSLVKTFVPHSPAPVSPLSDKWALRKCLADDWSNPANRGHLERSGRPLSVYIKRGWVPADIHCRPGVSS